MKNYKDIEGWFDYKNTYNFLVSNIVDNGIFVECGAWLGKSSSYLCDLAQERISVYIVDTWAGSFSETDPTFIQAQKMQNIYEIFLTNMGSRKFIPLKMESEQAASKFENNSLDVVFIDMTHTYEAVKRDISLWLPKIKNNGYISGHDYQKDWPGVIMAVDELLGKDNLILMDTCWIYKNER